MKVISSSAEVNSTGGGHRTVYFEAKVDINNEIISIDGDFSYYKDTSNGFNECRLDICAIQDLNPIKKDLEKIRFTCDPDDGRLLHFYLGCMFEYTNEWDKHFN